MPLDPLPPRACRSNPKYTFSEDETDEERDSPFNSPDVATRHLPPDSTLSISSSPPLSYPHPPRSSHSRKRSPCHIRRPRNAFIIFRSEFCDQQKMTNGGIETDHRQISRIAAHIWNSMPEDKKTEYKHRAEEEKAAHKAAYPDYRYAPVGRPRALVRHKLKRNTNEETVRCRKVAELYIAGVKGEDLDIAVKTLDEEFRPDSACSGTKSGRNGTRRQSVKKRKDTPRIPASKASQPENYVGSEEACSPFKDISLPESRSPELPSFETQEIDLLEFSHCSETIKEEAPDDSVLDVVCKTESMSPDFGRLDQHETLMTSPMDESPDDPFSQIILAQYLRGPPESPESCSSTLSYFTNPLSVDTDQKGVTYDANPESPFLTSTGSFFSEPSSKDTTSFGTQLEEEGVINAHFGDNNLFVYDDLAGFEQYLDL